MQIRAYIAVQRLNVDIQIFRSMIVTIAQHAGKLVHDAERTTNTVAVVYAAFRIDHTRNRFGTVVRRLRFKVQINFITIITIRFMFVVCKLRFVVVIVEYRRVGRLIIQTAFGYVIVARYRCSRRIRLIVCVLRLLSTTIQCSSHITIHTSAQQLIAWSFGLIIDIVTVRTLFV